MSAHLLFHVDLRSRSGPFFRVTLSALMCPSVRLYGCPYIYEYSRGVWSTYSYGRACMNICTRVNVSQPELAITRKKEWLLLLLPLRISIVYGLLKKEALFSFQQDCIEKKPKGEGGDYYTIPMQSASIDGAAVPFLQKSWTRRNIVCLYMLRTYIGN